MKKLLRVAIPWLLLCLVACWLSGLYLLRTRVVTGTVNQRAELKSVKEAELLFEMLPPKAGQIEYWISPYNRYCEARFQIGQDEFQQWIEDMLAKDALAGGTVKNAPSSASAPKAQPLGITQDIQFPVYSSEPFHLIQIPEGVLLDRISTNQFKEFAAVFDIRQERAYFYFYK